MSKSTICIHIFRRDYRLEDNTTLIEACKTHDIVIPIFIFTKTQIDKKLNPYRSDNCLQFLCESLVDLDKQLKHHNSNLILFYSEDEYSILDTLLKTFTNVTTISFNMDYTHYSQTRDNKIKDLCQTHKIKCLSLDDICLNPIGTVLNGSGKPYTKFTAFWRASAQKEIRKIIHNTYKNYYSSKQINDVLGKNGKLSKLLLTIDDIMKPNGLIMGSYNKSLPEKGGRDNGLAILHKIKQWDNYNDERDLLTYKTTHLSPFNKFGCVSIREVYWAIFNKLGKEGEFGLIRQLFWRDFFYTLSHFHPEIYIEKALNPKYRHIKWEVNKTSLEHFQKWCEGKTGFPVVDACMRELNTTGYMHNRGRLIVSNFLCRLLHIDWKMGERYFASKLYDYDPTQNNFGWQVSGSNTSGTTSRPLEQTIMNPWIQSEKFDKKGLYIKKWCTELENVEARDLHRWNEAYSKYVDKSYIKPIIDYKVEKEKNLKLYRKYLE